MFAVVYEFRVKEGQAQVFEQAWADFTEAIYRARGSLGSRLHRTSDSQTYVAYAQWPSEHNFNEVPGDEVYTSEELTARQQMRDAVLESKTIYKLQMCADHLRTASTAG